jgi:hypothetical protein
MHKYWMVALLTMAGCAPEGPEAGTADGERGWKVQQRSAAAPSSGARALAVAQLKAAREEGRVPGLDDEFLLLGTWIDGFAGLHIDPEARALVLSLTDVSQAQKAWEALDPVVEGLRDTHYDADVVKNLQVRDVAHEWLALNQVHTEVLELRADPEVTLLDIDEVANRAVFGVATWDAAERLRAELPEWTDHPEMVSFALQDLGEPLAGLLDSIRPVPAGVLTQGRATGSSYCSIGANVDRGFLLSASHCTRTMGGLDAWPREWKQNHRSTLASAREVSDPVWRSGISGCLSGEICRYSDVAKFQYLTSYEQGRYLRTSLTQNSKNELFSGARWKVRFLLLNPLAGQTVSKLGYRTGYTSAPVHRTCTAGPLNNDSPRPVALCMSQARATSTSATLVDRGDSGGGVFVLYSGDLVSFAGIISTGFNYPTSSNALDFYKFAPTSGIRTDLGSIDPHDPTSFSSGSTCGVQPRCPPVQTRNPVTCQCEGPLL